MWAYSNLSITSIISNSIYDFPFGLEVDEGGIPSGNCSRIVPEHSRKDRINSKAQ
jgi:hypothetical protein